MIPTIDDSQRFRNVRSYYFREMLAWWNESLEAFTLADFRLVHRVAHRKALDWYPRRYI